MRRAGDHAKVGPTTTTDPSTETTNRTSLTPPRMRQELSRTPPDTRRASGPITQAMMPSDDVLADSDDLSGEEILFVPPGRRLQAPTTTGANPTATTSTAETAEQPFAEEAQEFADLGGPFSTGNLRKMPDAEFEEYLKRFAQQSTRTNTSKSAESTGEPRPAQKGPPPSKHRRKQRNRNKKTPAAPASSTTKSQPTNRAEIYREAIRNSHGNLETLSVLLRKNSLIPNSDDAFRDMIKLKYGKKITIAMTCAEKIVSHFAQQIAEVERGVNKEIVSDKLIDIAKNILKQEFIDSKIIQNWIINNGGHSKKPLPNIVREEYEKIVNRVANFIEEYTDTYPTPMRAGESAFQSQSKFLPLFENNTTWESVTQELRREGFIFDTPMSKLEAIKEKYPDRSNNAMLFFTELAEMIKNLRTHTRVNDKEIHHLAQEICTKEILQNEYPGIDEYIRNGNESAERTRELAVLLRIVEQFACAYRDAEAWEAQRS
jgi:hypothetical protein